MDDDRDRVRWAGALTTAGWLLLSAYLLVLIAQIRRAFAIDVASFEDGIWGQRIEQVSGVTQPQSIVVLVPAAAAGVVAMLLLRDLPVDFARSWARQLVRIVAGLCYVAVVLATLGIVDVLVQAPDEVGGTTAILNRVGGIMIAIAIIRVCLEAERSTAMPSASPSASSP